MSSDGMFFLIFWGGASILLLILGIVIRLGKWRYIFAIKGFSVYVPRALAFVIIPTALTMLSLWLILVLPLEKEIRGNLVMTIFIPLLIVTYVLAIWQPWWLKPTWLRRLEKEHGDILEILWEEARMDQWKWERRVKTQEGLEAWVAEVREKNNL